MDTIHEGSEDLLNPSQVARLAGRSAATVRLWADDGRLPHVRTAAGVRLFRRGIVEAFLADRDRAKQDAEAV